MTLGGILAIIEGVRKFPSEIRWFIERLQKTPQEKLQEVIAITDAAFAKANAPGSDGRRSDDTSGIEDVING